MIPAKMTCPIEWSIECSGVLTSSAQTSSHHIGEYLCMDKNAEYLTEGDQQIDYNGRFVLPRLWFPPVPAV